MDTWGYRRQAVFALENYCSDRVWLKPLWGLTVLDLAVGSCRGDILLRVQILIGSSPVTSKKQPLCSRPLTIKIIVRCTTAV